MDDFINLCDSPNSHDACSQSSSQSTGTTSSTTSKTSAVTATTSKKTNKNNSNYFTSKDSDTSYNESSATKIKLSGSSADVSGDGAAYQVQP